MKIIKTNSIYKLDQFFTKDKIAKQCIENLNLTFKIDDFDLIIEPSAGKGAFINHLPKNKIVAIELDAKLCNDNPDYIHKSFFNYKCSLENKNILVVGNPPFGTQNSLSVDFFNHAAEFANVIAFIIPKTWNKQSIHNRLNEKFILVKSISLPKDCFDSNKETNVKCCFQIWKRSIRGRVKKIKIISHKDWNFISYTKTKNDLLPPKEADFVVLAYGSNPGQISTDLYRWRPKSVHFIKSKIEKNKLIKRLSTLDYSCANNSARQSSLCKADLVKLYSKKYGS